MTSHFSVTMRHLRPACWLCLWVHFLLGSILILGKSTLDLPFANALGIIVAGGTWAICLGGAAAALSAVFSAPARAGEEEKNVPAYVGYVGMALMLTGLVAAVAFSWWLFDVYLAAIVLIVLCLVPPFRLARIPVTAALATAAFAALSLYAGCVKVAALLRPDTSLSLAILGFVFLTFAVFAILETNSARAMPFLYIACLVNACTCLALAEFRRQQHWGIALLILPFAGWALLGIERYSPKGRATPRSRAGAAILLYLLTDAALGVSRLLL